MAPIIKIKINGLLLLFKIFYKVSHAQIWKESHTVIRGFVDGQRRICFWAYYGFVAVQYINSLGGWRLWYAKISMSVLEFSKRELRFVGERGQFGWNIIKRFRIDLAARTIRSSCGLASENGLISIKNQSIHKKWPPNDIYLCWKMQRMGSCMRELLPTFLIHNKNFYSSLQYVTISSFELYFCRVEYLLLLIGYLFCCLGMYFCRFG